MKSIKTTQKIASAISMQKKSILEIKQLRIMSKIGIYDWEQAIEQPLLLDISMPIPDEGFLDYAKICQQLTDYLTINSFKLIEDVAEDIAQLLKTTYSLPFIQLTVHKPLAIRNAQNVSISIER